MTTHYIVRQQSTSDDPAAKGTELARFLTWQEAQDYADAMWTENGIRAYVSIEVAN